MSLSLSLQVQSAFAADGVIARAIRPFHARQEQIDMAMAVARTIENVDVLVVEAGTGVGKTFSYLVPALLSGEKVIVSTATKNLQDQLFGRDLPRLVQALGLPIKTALLKGRSNYVCLHRLDNAAQEIAGHQSEMHQQLRQVKVWTQHTSSGDLSELTGLDHVSGLMPLITSTRDNCLGSQCPQHRDCHVMRARREAISADVLVVNHHLFFADLAVRESGMAELLPTMQVVIFDEAHQLNEIGVQLLGAQLGTAQLIDFARDMLATGLQLARGLQDWQELSGAVELAARDLRLSVAPSMSDKKLRWVQALPQDLADPTLWQHAWEDLNLACHHAVQALERMNDRGPDMARLHERGVELTSLLEKFSQARELGAVRWAEVAGAQLRLVESPLDIAQALRSRLLGKADAPLPTSTPPVPPRAWIFTSATLGDDEGLSWFTQPCGLEDAQILRVGSPFDYARQAALYVPSDLVPPSDPAHSQQVAELVAQAAQRIGGRTLVLTTSLRALRLIGAALQAHWGQGGAIEVLVQGAQSKQHLIERFRAAVQTERGCVLVASASFWEGIDVPGEALQLVVIDKLPFPSPQDPLVEARSERLSAAGRSAFKDYSLPEAAVSLKQGAGRLIRRETDQGVLVVCDTRMASKGYGLRLRLALPPMRQLHTLAEFEQALDHIAATNEMPTEMPASS